MPEPMPEKDSPRIAILGGGPAGLGAAWQLHVQQRGRATLIEQNPWFGGNAGSFEWEGQKLDFGSHRLHPACEPKILADLKQLLGAELLDRPRHGRIRLMGRFIHFPLKPLDLLLRLNPSFGASMLLDSATKPFRKPAAGARDTFESVLWQSLGPTMCRRFYFPYGKKIWGRDPAELSGIQARRRVSAGTLLKLIRKVLNAVPGLKKPGSGRFWYPRQAYGQLSDALGGAAEKAGATLLREARVKKLIVPKSAAAPWRIEIEPNGRGGAAAAVQTLEADHVWSTLPVTLLPRMVDVPVPPEVTAAACAVTYRAMLLIYLRLPIERFTEFDAHYFPESEITITRLSEPKNYSDLATPRGATTLCAELPCDADGPLFRASDAELGELVAADLARAGLPLPVKPTGVKVMRLPQAYPIYLDGYEAPLAILDQFAASLPRFLTYGRQGLFAHDNTHHALAMAYGAVECVRGRDFDGELWARHRAVFATHVVED